MLFITETTFLHKPDLVRQNHDLIENTNNIVILFFLGISRYNNNSWIPNI